MQGMFFLQISDFFSRKALTTNGYDTRDTMATAESTAQKAKSNCLQLHGVRQRLVYYAVSNV